MAALSGLDATSPVSGVESEHPEVLSMSKPLIVKDPEILGGTAVFAGTRVPIHILFEHLESGDRLDDFLDNYPTVTREQAVQLLERAAEDLAKAG
jgi:uncharacterized protein (DUF433 family)